jgi:trimethylamine--corrinoid protein Co-methyltransferase
MTEDIIPSFADLRTLLWDYGSIIRGRWLACRVQMISEFYGCPSGVHGAKTNSCFIDVQTGIDKTATTLMPVLAGAIGIGAAGHLENALTFCPEQLVIDAEIAQAVRHMLGGIEVGDDAAAEALDAIGRVGPGGNFLADEHTLDHIRDEVRPSPLFHCYGWDSSRSADFQTVVERARRMAADLMSAAPLPPAPGGKGSHPVATTQPVLTGQQEAEIGQIVAEAAARLGVEDPAPW